jgi:Dyp-type peroxidase family
MQLLESVATARDKPQETAIQLAMTSKGLDALGLPKKILATFSDPFRSGMDTAHKRRILGDSKTSSPDLWQWGGPMTDPVHILLLCYAVSAAALGTLVHKQLEAAAAAGLTLIQQLPGQMLADHREHFGFKDGMAQPYIAEFDTSSRVSTAAPVPLGEFVMGYPNGYGRFTQRPLLSPTEDPEHVLPGDLAGSGLQDLGRNGSYLVYRQLEQDVPRFWSFLLDQGSDEVQGSSVETADNAIRLAAKMVGRWPNGVPLVKATTQAAAEVVLKELRENTSGNVARALDDFLYHEQDAAGHHCPLGAHIRRSNPRDSLDPEPGSPQSIAFSDRHRLLRRGRPYGKPICDPVSPDKIIETLQGDQSSIPDNKRGLHFLCLGANIQRQFEFVQYTWCTNPNFNGLYDDPDPLIGARSPHGKQQDHFTIQHPFVREQIRGLPDFVHTRGGAYFFLPGKRALKYILLSCV